jgi:hypothetical protein
MPAVDNIFITGKTARLIIERTDDAVPISIPCTSVTIATKIIENKLVNELIC